MTTEEGVTEAFDMMWHDVEKVGAEFIKSGIASKSDIKKLRDAFSKKKRKKGEIEFSDPEDFIIKWLKANDFKIENSGTIITTKYDKDKEKVNSVLKNENKSSHAGAEIELLLFEILQNQDSSSSFQTYVTMIDNYVQSNGLRKSIGSKQSISDNLEMIIENTKREYRKNFILDLCAAPELTRRAAPEYSDSYRSFIPAAKIISDDDSDYVATVLYHFVWQVKRKMIGRPVKHHMMPIFTGTQGLGKSVFIEDKLLKPIHDFMKKTDFNLIDEGKAASLFQNFVLFFDEMSGIRKADVNGIKGAITDTTRTYRPMRTNEERTITNNATFIGATNETLDVLIKDESGARRFAAIKFGKNNTAPYLNPEYDKIDWQQLWYGVCPYNDCIFDTNSELHALVKRKIAETRYIGSFENWAFDESTIAQFKFNASGGNKSYKTAKALYENFKSFMENNYPKAHIINMHEFSKKIKNISENNSDKIKHKKINDIWHYSWV
ncbi:virulence-associated protein E [Gluconacetobacter diazotrophicus]|nr:virulence-associated protein E [Gluconacetobacter diazotrophicus]